jgi:aminoglycoside phosphotransferase (APT) family kinase protein
MDDIAIEINEALVRSLLRTEQQSLPALAPGLPLPGPSPVRIGEPSERFPQTWNVVRWVTGTPADLSPIDRPEAAGTLAGFLRALHRPAPADAPANPDRGDPVKSLARDFDGSLAVIEASDLAAGARRVWDQAVAAAAFDGAPVWLHGDLHPANVLVSNGTLCGVIDFGDMCAGDPATDLSAAWLLLPAGAATPFLRLTRTRTMRPSSGPGGGPSPGPSASSGSAATARRACQAASPPGFRPDGPRSGGPCPEQVVPACQRGLSRRVCVHK